MLQMLLSHHGEGKEDEREKIDKREIVSQLLTHIIMHARQLRPLPSSNLITADQTSHYYHEK